MAATVASSTPAARPRQPAWAAPTTRPSSSARRTGMQSATRMARGTSTRRVTTASASGRVASDVAQRASVDRRHAAAVHLLQPHRVRGQELADGARPAKIAASTRALVQCLRMRGPHVQRHRQSGPDRTVARRGEARNVGRRLPRRHDPVDSRGAEALRDAHAGRAIVREAAPREARSAAKSAGSGDVHSHARRVTGCTSASRSACSAWRRNDRNASGDSRGATAIDGIADQRVVERREVHADLVGAAGLEAAAHERGRAVTLDHVDVGSRGLAARHHGHRRALHRMTADRRIDDDAAGEIAAHQREIVAGDGARLQLPHEVGLRLLRLGDDHEPAGVLVEAMHDARTRRAVRTRARDAAAR